MNEMLQAEAARLRDGVVRFTQELIRIPSPSLHENRLAERIQGEMRNLDFDLSFIDEVGNAIGVIAGDDPKNTVLLNSHMNTAPTGPLEMWSFPPYGGEVCDDRILGLGASDCKGGIASQIYAAHLLDRSRVDRRVNVVVAASVAEESGCSLGVRHLLRTTLPKIGVEAKFCILGEPTALDMCIGHDGWASFDLDVSAMNPEVSACAAEIVHRALRMHCDSDERDRKTPVMVLEQPVLASADDSRSLRIRVLRRLFSGETFEEITQWLGRLAARELSGIHRVRVDVRLHEEEREFSTGLKTTQAFATRPWTTNLMHPLVDRARESLLTAGIGWNPRLWTTDRLGMGTAGGVLSVDFGVPTIGFGPGEESQAFAADESVSVTNLLEAAFGTAVLIHGFNGPAGMGSHPKAEHAERRVHGWSPLDQVRTGGRNDPPSNRPATERKEHGR